MNYDNANESYTHWSANQNLSAFKKFQNLVVENLVIEIYIYYFLLTNNCLIVRDLYPPIYLHWDFRKL